MTTRSPANPTEIGCDLGTPIVITECVGLRDRGLLCFDLLLGLGYQILKQLLGRKDCSALLSDLRHGGVTIPDVVVVFTWFGILVEDHQLRECLPHSFNLSLQIGVLVFGALPIGYQHLADVVANSAIAN